jgi:ubiquinone/menaquinone biosynthesis C-methylase UbiE
MPDMRAKMFNRRASRPQSKADAVIKSLDLRPGQIIADIGSGGGFFSFRFAQEVGKSGKVYAVDVNSAMLKYVRKESVTMGLSNLSTVPARDFFSAVSPGSLNIVFLRDVYHHLDDPVKYFAQVRKCLKPDGKVVIIDYRGDTSGLSFFKLFKHSVTPNQVTKDMTEAGYAPDTSFDYLPEQYFMVFKQKNSSM